MPSDAKMCLRVKIFKVEILVDFYSRILKQINKRHFLQEIRFTLRHVLACDGPYTEYMMDLDESFWIRICISLSLCPGYVLDAYAT